jgi:hypothetical protein
MVLIFDTWGMVKMDIENFNGKNLPPAHYSSTNGIHRANIAAMFASLLAAGMIYEISLRASRDSTFYRVAACVVCGGVAITVAGLADQVLHIFQYFDFNYWVAMATAGVIAIVLASLLESQGVRVKAWFSVYRKRYSHWSY